ncbi:DNA primase [bacterium]|nr:DNA primase [bacterium]
MRNSAIEEIKSKLDIVDVIGSYIKLQKAGANYRALCPFHPDKNPSLYISPARQIWKCFGCGAGGSVFDFVMKIEGIEFGDALRILARKAGVELKSYRPELQTKRQRLYEICELSCQFFEKQLKEGSSGKRAKDYLIKRGLDEETISKWRLGYAPNMWQGVFNFLISKGYKKEEIVEAGLAVRKDARGEGIYYDRFRGRIIFPVFDLNSQVIGFGGRILATSREKGKDVDGKTSDIEPAKYINTPNTLLYDKSYVLYGLNFAKMDIRKEDAVVLVEGYMDVILSHKAGVKNVVASSGTALTPSQLDILKRYSENLITSFDMDTAGFSATERGIGLAQERGFNVRVIVMPQGSDPADVASKNPQKWQKLVAGSEDIFTFYFENAFSKFDKKSSEGIRSISNILLPRLKSIPNKILQAHWAKELARRLNVSSEVIFEELNKLKKTVAQGHYPEGGVVEKEISLKKIPRQNLIEEKLLSLVFQKPGILDLIKKIDNHFFSESFNIIVGDFEQNFSGSPEKLDAFFSTSQDKYKGGLKNLLESAALMAEVEKEKEPEKEAEICLKQIMVFNTRSQLEKLSEEIKEAEQKGDQEKTLQLVKEFDEKSKLLREL